MTLPLSDLELRDTPSLTVLRPNVEEELRLVLLRYHIPEFDAEELLRETVVELLYKAEGPDDFGRRVGPVLQAKCRAYWLTRRWRRFNTLAENSTKPASQSSAAQPNDELSPTENRAASTASRVTLGRRLVAAWRRSRNCPPS